MKTTMMAALAAAQLSVAVGPAQAAGPPREDSTARQTAFEADAELNFEVGQASAAPRAADPREDEPRKKKRKSTGDKVLTGAAVVLGIGAVAVGALLIAFVAN